MSRTQRTAAACVLAAAVLGIAAGADVEPSSFDDDGRRGRWRGPKPRTRRATNHRAYARVMFHAVH